MPETNDAAMMDRLTELFVQPVTVHTAIGANGYLEANSDKVVLSIRMIESMKHKGNRPGYCRNHKHDVLVNRNELIELLQHMLGQLEELEEEDQQQRQAKRLRAARIAASVAAELSEAGGRTEPGA
jgi:hypothetical protein